MRSERREKFILLSPTFGNSYAHGAFGDLEKATEKLTSAVDSLKGLEDKGRGVCNHPTLRIVISKGCILGISLNCK